MRNGTGRIRLILGAALLFCGSAAHAEEFYAGKQITFIVGAGPGGGYDLQARVAARHLGKHIPGNPSVIVQNVPSRIAAANNMFSTVAKDGTVIALVQRGIMLAKLIYPSGVRYDIEKFHWLGSLTAKSPWRWPGTPLRTGPRKTCSTRS